jgi:succinoglycan biosynthesis protein ExoA
MILRPRSPTVRKPVNDSAAAEPAEPRSFAPDERTARRWPAAWETLTPERIIRPPDSPDGARDRELIVMRCFNDAADVASTIAGVLDDESLLDPLLLVVDGGSTDGSVEIVSWIAARDPRVRLVQS